MVVASSSGRFQSITRLRSRIGTRAVDVDRAVGLRPHARHRDVVLVGDVADDLLEDVLERDQAHHLAVLVDHQREMRLAAAERLELLATAARMSGTNHGGRAIATTSILAASPPPAWSARSRSLACRMPTMFSGVPRHSGRRVTGAASTASTISLGRIVGVDRHHLGAVDHHVGDRRARAGRAGRRACRGRASRRRLRGAGDRPRRAVPRAPTGSTDPRRPACRQRAASAAPAHSIAHQRPAPSSRTDRSRSAARPAAPCGRAR